jgi:8-oxo-dGDP phosphatase
METLGTRRVYENPWMSVREDQVRRADGSTGIYAVVDTADIAVVIPLADGRFHLVEQYRYPVVGRRWEFPAGSAEEVDGTDPAALARRELREETGLVANDLTVLGTLEVTPSMIAHRCTVYLATEFGVAGEPQRDPAEQDMRSAWFTRDDVDHMVHTGQIVDAKSIAALMLLSLHESRRPPQR